MELGYIHLETHPQHPHLVRCVKHTALPQTLACENGAQMRYIARCPNLFRGYQQIQNALNRAMVDCDNGLFKVDLIDAIAAIESGRLRPARVWLDPALDDSSLDTLKNKTEQIRAHAEHVDRMWHRVGYGFLGFLVLRVLGLI